MTYPADGAAIRCKIGPIAVPDDAAEIVRQLVMIEPPPIKRAWHTVAVAFGLPPGFIRKVWKREISVSPQRAALIRAGHADALRARIRRLDADRAAVVARLDKLEGTRGDARSAGRNFFLDGGGMDRRLSGMRLGGRALP